VARVLPKFPLIAKAFEAARVSYSKVRAITRVATPENEALLVDLATSAPASVLETLCRRFRGVARAERETPEEADERRKVVFHHTGDGRLRLSVELDADEGARLLAALDLARFDVSAETPRTTFDVPAETPRTRADALMVLVEKTAADSSRTPDALASPRRRRDGSPATRRWSRSPVTRPAGPCARVARRARSRPGCGARRRSGTSTGARSRALPTRDSWTRTTSSTGWTAA